MKKMTRRHYMLMIVLIVITSLMSIPYTFVGISYFGEFIENYKVSSYITIQVTFTFYWIFLLSYLYKKHWKFSFYIGVVLAITSGFLFFGGQFLGDSLDPETIFFMGLLSLLHVLVYLIYGISFFATNRTANHRLIRIYALIHLASLLVMLTRGFLSELNTFYVPGIIDLLQAIVLLLHLVYERHNHSRSVDSDEILDVI